MLTALISLFALTTLVKSECWSPNMPGISDCSPCLDSDKHSGMCVRSGRWFTCYPDVSSCCKDPEIANHIDGDSCVNASGGSSGNEDNICTKVVSKIAAHNNDHCFAKCDALVAAGIDVKKDAGFNEECMYQHYQIVNGRTKVEPTCFEKWVYGYSEPNDNASYQQGLLADTPAQCQLLCQKDPTCVNWLWASDVYNDNGGQDVKHRCDLKSEEMVSKAALIKLYPDHVLNSDSKYCNNGLAYMCNGGGYRCLPCGEDGIPSCIWESDMHVTGWRTCEPSPVCSRSATTLAPPALPTSMTSTTISSEKTTTTVKTTTLPTTKATTTPSTTPEATTALPTTSEATTALAPTTEATTRETTTTLPTTPEATTTLSMTTKATTALLPTTKATTTSFTTPEATTALPTTSEATTTLPTTTKATTALPTTAKATTTREITTTIQPTLTTPTSSTTMPSRTTGLTSTPKTTHDVSSSPMTTHNEPTITTTEVTLSESTLEASDSHPTTATVTRATMTRRTGNVIPTKSPGASTTEEPDIEFSTTEEDSTTHVPVTTASRIFHPCGVPCDCERKSCSPCCKRHGIDINIRDRPKNLKFEVAY